MHAWHACMLRTAMCGPLLHAVVGQLGSCPPQHHLHHLLVQRPFDQMRHKSIPKVQCLPMRTRSFMFGIQEYVLLPSTSQRLYSVAQKLGLQHQGRHNLGPTW